MRSAEEAPVPRVKFDEARAPRVGGPAPGLDLRARFFRWYVLRTKTHIWTKNSTAAAQTRPMRTTDRARSVRGSISAVWYLGIGVRCLGITVFFVCGNAGKINVKGPVVDDVGCHEQQHQLRLEEHGQTVIGQADVRGHEQDRPGVTDADGDGARELEVGREEAEERGEEQLVPHVDQLEPPHALAVCLVQEAQRYAHVDVRVELLAEVVECPEGHRRHPCVDFRVVCVYILCLCCVVLCCVCVVMCLCLSLCCVCVMFVLCLCCVCVVLCLCCVCLFCVVLCCVMCCVCNQWDRGRS